MRYVIGEKNPTGMRKRGRTGRTDLRRREGEQEELICGEERENRKN
jgi:hypothetical protein